MQDIISRLNNLHRPALLMRAARIGADKYRRTGHLCRLLGAGTPPRHGPALMHLIEMEAELNDQRKMADASYCLVRHVEVVIAIIGEARMLRSGPDQIT
ncbi:hypothetical protein SAMN04488040_0792 [Sulfitobacter marinus]|uniref:Uncharacterized protein n=1 Tax=Sulfitobacter marinus TaxID=394264 RepID=A0A1I6QLK7_9RHOB|nr:DUF6477 family protein [Sulfitobacter marinus]SFS53339.1 hypothetical protein SAMN04488040_0792 [Sulfitobacter marinus]